MRATLALFLAAMALAACSDPAPVPTSYPAHTPFPPPSPYPTYTPLPTHTPYPTYTAAPLPSPRPTYTPYPTYTPLPTYTPYPTSTRAAAPTAAPAPPAVTARPTPSSTPLPIPTLSPTPANRAIPIFDRPFAGEYPLGNFFDHDLPYEFKDSNGYQLTWWGERTGGVDGHNGYDWLLPEGTPVLAVADGEVLFAGTLSNFECPPLGYSVDEPVVEVLHDSAQGERFSTSYVHLARVSVKAGERVRTGQVIGLSGRGGCAEGPHLHFGVRRWTNTNNGRTTWVDPYGWDGDRPDPWAQHPEGAVSVWLWKDGRAPALLPELRAAANPGSTDRAPVAITALRYMGRKDSQFPNNEFVQLELDQRYAPSGSFDLTGFGLRNNRGDTYSFPRGFTIRQGAPVKVYTGPGTNSSAELYWGRPGGVWDNLGDCARLVHPGDGLFPVWYRFWYLNATCPS